MRNLTALIFTTSFWAVSLNANAAIIDTFDDGPDFLFAPITGSGPSTVLTSTAIGGARTIEITGGTGTQIDVDGMIGGPQDTYSHSQNANTQGASRITWNTMGQNEAGFDLTYGGIDDAIQLDILSIDQGFVALTFTVTSYADENEFRKNGNSSTLTLNNLTDGQHAFLFTEFSGGADFTDVYQITLDIDAGLESDLVIDSIHTRAGKDISPVPLPGALIFMSFGGMSLFRFAMRKDKNAA